MRIELPDPVEAYSTLLGVAWGLTVAYGPSFASTTGIRTVVEPAGLNCSVTSASRPACRSGLLTVMGGPSVRMTGTPLSRVIGDGIVAASGAPSEPSDLIALPLIPVNWLRSPATIVADRKPSPRFG